MRKSWKNINNQDIGIASRSRLEKLLLARDRLFANSLEESSKEKLSIKEWKFATRFLQRRLVCQSNVFWEMSRFLIISLHRPRSYSTTLRNSSAKWTQVLLAKKNARSFAVYLRKSEESRPIRLKSQENLE